MHTHTWVYTRAKYGRLSSSSPFSVPSAFVHYSRMCICEYDATISLSLSLSFFLSLSLSFSHSCARALFASCKRYSQAPSKFAPVSAVVSVRPRYRVHLASSCSDLRLLGSAGTDGSDNGYDDDDDDRQARVLPATRWRLHARTNIFLFLLFTHNPKRGRCHHVTRQPQIGIRTRSCKRAETRGTCGYDFFDYIAISPFTRSSSKSRGRIFKNASESRRLNRNQFAFELLASFTRSSNKNNRRIRYNLPTLIFASRHVFFIASRTSKRPASLILLKQKIYLGIEKTWLS